MCTESVSGGRFSSERRASSVVTFNLMLAAVSTRGTQQGLQKDEDECSNTAVVQWM